MTDKASMSIGQTVSSPPRSGIGYKRPPADKRFVKGRSGNPKGRPKGAPNAADILKVLLNEKVSVREGNRVRKVAKCEAIILRLVAKAQSGDARAIDTVNWLRQKFGAPAVTSEERVKRTLRLPRSLERDEYDLLHADGREKERQLYLAIAEHQAAADSTNLTPVDVGDQRAMQGKADDALAAYGRQIAICQTRLTNDASDALAQKHYKRAIARIGLLADQFLFAGEFATALKCADEAIAQGGVAITYGITIDLTWVELIRAHVNMFLGRTDEARQRYLRFHSLENIAMTNWEMLILQDFERLRSTGYSSPLMIEIEQKLAAAGWRTDGFVPQKKSSAMSSDDRYFTIVNPEDLKTAALYRVDGKLDDARKVYERTIQKCRATLQKEPGSSEAAKTMQAAITQFSALARQFLEAARFPSAVECAEQLMVLAPKQYDLQAVRAHALMFIGNSEEARELYLRYRGHKIGEAAWETVVLADFKKFREAGRATLLMADIEALFKNDPTEVDTTPIHEIRNAEAVVAQPDDIGSADRLFEQGKVDEALEVYRRRIEICQGKLVNGRTNMQALEDRQIAVDRISDLSFYLTVNREFEKALALADEASRLLPNSVWANVRRAHILMFLNRQDEARVLYQRYCVGKADPERTWASVLGVEFAQMRKCDLSHPLMAEVERDLSGVAV